MRSLPLIIIIFLAAGEILAQSPHGKDLNLDCSFCHKSVSWKVIPDSMKFDHEVTGFKLTGQHRTIDCKSCHQSLVFSEAKKNQDCFSCHKDVHQGSVGFDCQRCHTPQTWIVKDINVVHQESRFPLVGAHKLADCEQCHKNYQDLNFQVIQIDCYSCHQTDYMNAANPNHVEAGFSTNCEDCHDVTSMVWSTVNFMHDFFPLVGGHNIQDCFACHHQGSNFKGLSTECYSCHRSDYDHTNDPNHITLGFPTDCQQCHTINGWSPATFDHSTTQFPLTGAHLTAECSACHSQGFAGTPMDCYSCHQNSYNNAANPNHVAAGISTICSDCHTTTAFIPSTFNHTTTGFELTGRHTNLECSACHQGTTSNADPACFSCHESDYNGAENHLAQHYPTDCTLCHNTSSWGDANFDHNTTGFPLTGAHQTTECAACHQNGFSTPPPTDCVSCHQTNYNTTTNPNHQAIGIPTNCENCHTTNPGWQPATFPIHNNYYELIGAHAAIANNCAQCHNGNYNNTPNQCYGCHANDYNNTNDPNHQAAGFGTDCQTCHSQTAWQPATFDHDAQYFPIYSGSHEGKWQHCSDCHTQPTNFSVFTCVTCHELNQTNEEHQGVQGYVYESNACYACHPTGSGGGAFNHDLSGFPLTGAHLTVECTQCHTNGYNNPPPTVCSGCHLPDYNATNNPNHQSLGISTDCETCHTTNPGWQPAQFPQHSQYFELLGQHATITDCNDCHNGNYNLPSAACVQCHQNDYNNTVNPNHVAAGIPTTCEDCHTFNGWVPSTFNHSTTGFVLDGAHAPLQCSACHQGTIQGLNPACVSCHQNDYNNAANPNHVAAGIPVTCQDCHTTTAFIPSTFNHSTTGFPLLGVHAQIQCSECHQGIITGLSPNCLPCHQNDYNNAPNHVALNYPTNCDMCHSFDGWTPVIFDHNNTNFPLTGAHLQVPCSSCHASGFVGTPTACFACHETDYNNSTNPSHTALQLPTNCETCHTTNPGWQPATFPIHSNYFVFVGAHIPIQNDCYACHHGDYNNTPNTCYGCHVDNYNATTDPPHQQLNFPHECLNCHTQDGWQPATFDHSFYVLYGVHSTMDCNNCHSEANYQPQCLSCHYDDFLEGHNPGDPTNCWNCHSTNHFGDAKPMKSIKRS